LLDHDGGAVVRARGLGKITASADDVFLSHGETEPVLADECRRTRTLGRPLGCVERFGRSAIFTLGGGQIPLSKAYHLAVTGRPWMNVEITSESSENVLAALSGELDADNCAEVGATMLDENGAYCGGADLVIDVSGLTFIDSSGLSELLRIRRAVTDAGHQLSLLQPTATVRRTMEISGLNEVFGIS
jgi:anti-sigma B factor antagonist